MNIGTEALTTLCSECGDHGIENPLPYVTVYRKTGHNAACVNIEKRSIDFLKMYCFKRTEGNG